MGGNEQLEFWKGEFGDAYIGRNDFSEAKLAQGVTAFKRILGPGYPISSILEVGSNIGLNLWFLRQVLGEEVKLYAVEPNLKAFKILTGQDLFRLDGAWQADAFHLPQEDNSVDLAFTSGVLIHIHPNNLGLATDEIVRVARKYVLCIEYFSHVPTDVTYRENTGVLFKRDFGSFYLDRYPQLKPISYGFLWQREFEFFDNHNWWLFEKS